MKNLFLVFTLLASVSSFAGIGKCGNHNMKMSNFFDFNEIIKNGDASTVEAASEEQINRCPVKIIESWKAYSVNTIKVSDLTNVTVANIDGIKKPLCLYVHIDYISGSGTYITACIRNNN